MTGSMRRAILSAAAVCLGWHAVHLPVLLARLPKASACSAGTKRGLTARFLQSGDGGRARARGVVRRRSKGET